MSSKITDIIGGLAGKILRVNLSTGEIKTEATEKYARQWLGGRAINSWLLLYETSPETKWSDAENPLIIGAGCLVGTSAPTACRVSIDTINAFNNGKGSANFGGHFGAELKYAGFDHVIITGKSPKPVYLRINDGDVQLLDADFIWGKTTDVTEEALRKKYKDSRLRVASIGPAGENLVKGSGIFCDIGQAAGGSGVGCIMGNKKLKAIAVRGHGSLSVANPRKFAAAVKSALEKIEASPGITGGSTFASLRKGYILSHRYGEHSIPMPVRNAQDEYYSAERAAKLLGRDEGVPKFQKRIWSCFGCPVSCQTFMEIADGQYRGTHGFTYWGNSILYSGRVDSDNPDASLKFQLMTNKLGLDADTASVSIAWAFECYEKGLLTIKDTDGLRLVWGNDEAWIRMTEKLAYREGIGELLADGVLEASRKLGKGSEAFIAHCKGQDTVESFRGNPGWALGVATSPVAGHHLRGAVMTPEISGPKNLKWSADSIENQAEAVFWQLRTKEIEDAAGICCFMGTLGAVHALEAKDYAELINAALGTEFNGEELMAFGQKAYNLEKAFNTLHTGFTRADDYPPERFMKETVISGPRAGRKVEKSSFDAMLDEFYDLNGWDRVTGWQTVRVLETLGLKDVSRRLQKVGRLIK